MGMSGALVIQSLKDKRSEIHGQIAAYEAQIAQARHDLAHVSPSLTTRFLLIYESPLTDALFLLVSKSDEVTTT